MSAVRYKRKRQSYHPDAPPRRSPATRRRTQNGWSMKLGAWAHARLREAQYDSLSRKVLQGCATFILVSMFFAIASALGIFTDVGNFLKDKSVIASRAIGFSVKNVEITPIDGRSLSEAQKAEAMAIAGVIDDETMFAVSPNLIRDRIMVLPWVENVIVRRLWPDNIQILIVPREANALWQENGTLEFIDAKGKKLGPADPQKVKNLPLVIGENAGANAPIIFNQIREYRAIANHTYALEFVSNRRWNLRLRNGAKVLLPEGDIRQSLETLEQLQNKYQILDRDFARLDVRIPGTLIIRPRAESSRAAIQNV